MAGPAGRRDRVSVEVLLDALPVSLAGRRVLVVDEPTGRAAVSLPARGAEVASWTRWSAEPEPPPGPFDLVLLRLPREKDYLDMLVELGAARLAPGGELWVVGANDEGARSAGRRLARVLDDVETVDARRHCRAWRGRRPADVSGLRGRIGQWRREGEIALPGGPPRWASYPGTFARGGLDRATAELVARLPDLPPGARVLDFACGTGVLAAAVLARQPEARVDMLDASGIALLAARENVPGARALHSDAWSAVRGERYDLVLSNPPLHAGKERSLAVLEALLRGAPEHLRPGGELLLVTWRHVPVARLDPGAELFWEDGRTRIWRRRA